MKRVQDPKLKTSKIQQILKQYFSKENGVGVDGQILKEILATPADKVTASMLISAQGKIFKKRKIWTVILNFSKGTLIKIKTIIF